MYDVMPLCEAIVKRAVMDYKLALRKRDFYAIAELEKFFLSDYGQLLSRDHGELIIEKCKKTVKK